MRSFRKLGTFLSIALVGSMFVAFPVSAKGEWNDPDNYYRDDKDTYTQSYSGLNNTYTEEQEENLYDQCQIYDDPYDRYADTTVAKNVYFYQNDEYDDYYVGDMRYLLEYGLFALPMDESTAFDYGAVFINNGNGNTICECKCSESDYENLLEYKESDIDVYKDDGFICEDDEVKEYYTYEDDSDYLTVQIIKK